MDIKGLKSDPYNTHTKKTDNFNRTQSVTREKIDSTAGEGTTLQGDTVKFSSEAKLRMEGYKEAMKGTEIREEKVAEIKAAIESGRYKIDSDDIAKNMLRAEFELFG